MSYRRLELDFGARRRRPRTAALVLAAAGVVLSGGAALHLGAALEQRSALKTELARAEAATGAAPRAPARPAAVDPRALSRVRASRTVADSLQRPWDDLLGAMELRPHGDVALLAVEPSALKRSVRITAEARSEAAMLEHLALLQQDGRLLDVALVSHQRQLQAPGAPWRYQIQGSW